MNPDYTTLHGAALKAELHRVNAAYKRILDKRLNLDMSRGKPNVGQLNLTESLLRIVHDPCKTARVRRRNRYFRASERATVLERSNPADNIILGELPEPDVRHDGARHALRRSRLR